MHLFELALLDVAAAAEFGRLRYRAGGPGEARKTFFDIGDYRGVIDRAGGGHHDVGRAIVPPEIVAQRAAVERPHRLGGAEDGAAERLLRESDGVQMLEYQIVRGVGDGADLLDDDALLAGDLLAVEGGIGQDIGEHVQRQRYVGLEHARIIGRGLGAGRRIEIAADCLDLFGDLAGGAPPRALERHVFEKMRNAVLVAALVAAAGGDPDAERGGLEMRHRIGHHVDAGFQGRYLDTHAAAPSCAARLVLRTKRSTADWSTGSAVTRSGRLSRSQSHSGSCGRAPQAASTASGNFAACAVDSTTIGTAGSRGSFSATAMPTAVWGSTKLPVSRLTVRMVEATSSSSARPAAKCARICESAGADSAKRRDCASEPISALMAAPSRS